MMFGKKLQIIYVTRRTRDYVRSLAWVARGFAPSPDRALLTTQVAVPGSLVTAAWALQNAVMAINRDPAGGPIEPTVLDADLRTDLDGIRAVLVRELMPLSRYNTTRQTFDDKEQDAA